MKRPTPGTSSAGKPVVSLPCTCANLRRAARIVTQLYDQELRPTGLRVTQFTLLQALARARNISQGCLGELLGLDSTTLTRTLALLRSKGWIQAKRGSDCRQIRLMLTPSGRREYRRVLPYWLSAEKRLRKSMGKVRWNGVMEAAIRTAALAQEP
jgi:DNA-binding MarR family transcriptional regulator